MTGGRVKHFDRDGGEWVMPTVVDAWSELDFSLSSPE